MLFLTNINNKILNINITYNNIVYNYNNICYKPNGKCQISCALEYYDYKISQKLNIFGSIYDFINKTINDTYHSNSIMCAYYLDQMINYGSVLDSFDHEFIKTLQEISYPNHYEMSYFADFSFNDEFSKAILTDTFSFIESFICLSIFSIIALIRLKKQKWCFNICPYSINSVKSRGIMGIIGIISASLAVLSCFGIVGGLLKIEFNAVVSISPFLLIGLGIDDAFVLLRSYDLTNNKLNIQNRIILTMKRGGVSILFTSLTDLVAFCIGYVSKFKAVSSFCVYCGVGVFLDFIFQITFFLGFMVLHSKLQKYGCKRCICFKKKNK